MPSPKLTPVQAEVLGRLTNEWQFEWRLVGAPRADYDGGRLSGNRATLKVLVAKGYAEQRHQFGHMVREYCLVAERDRRP